MRELRVELPDGVDARIGEALWRLGDARQRTLVLLRGVSDEQVDAPPAVGANTVGTLLYHVAAIELDWLYADLLQEPFPDGGGEWFPVDVRDAAGDLSTVSEPLGTHLDRLAWVLHHLAQHEAEHRGQIELLLGSR